MELVAFGTTEVSTLALCQSGAVVACLYRDDRAGVEHLIGEEGEIVHWHLRPDSWPPSTAVIRANNGDFFVYLTGTVNLPQWRGNIVGTFAREDTKKGALVNGQWRYAADSVKAELVSVFGGQAEGKTVRYCGHSYGGAVAQILAFDRVDLGEVAEVITFGSPKAYTGGYSGPIPSSNWRIASNQDLVSFLPPDINTGVFLKWVNVPVPTVQTVVWEHYGNGLRLNWDGELNGVNPPPLNGPEGVEYGPIAEHKMSNYRARLLQRVSNIEPSALSIFALNVWAGAPQVEEKQNLTDQLPGVVPGPPGGLWVNVPFYDGIPSSYWGFPGGLNMANPIPLGKTDPMKLTFKINKDRWGWSEVAYMYVPATPNVDPYDVAARWASKWAALRRELLHNSCILEAVQISNDQEARDSTLTFTPDYNLGKGKLTGTPASIQQGLLYTRYDGSNKVRGVSIFRGLTTELVSEDPLGGPFPTNRPAALASWWDKMDKLLTEPFQYKGLLTAVPCMKTYDRDKNSAAIISVGNFALTNDGYLSVTPAPGSVFSASPGKTVVLSHFRKDCVRGLTGKTRIVRLDGDAPNQTIVLAKRPKCGVQGFVGLSGTLREDATIYVQVKESYWGRIAHRNVGSAFFGTRGRQKRRS